MTAPGDFLQEAWGSVCCVVSLFLPPFFPLKGKSLPNTKGTKWEDSRTFLCERNQKAEDAKKDSGTPSTGLYWDDKFNKIQQGKTTNSQIMKQIPREKGGGSRKMESK